MGSKRSSRRPRMRDTKSQKRKKKLLQHFGGKKQNRDFAHKVINDAWDHKKTLLQNYHALGLATDPNKALPVLPEGIHGSQKEKVKFVENPLVLAELDKIQNMGTAPAYEVKSMNIKEQARIKALLVKYGEDYEAMARDFKINIMQETEAQLKKRVALYKRLQSL